MAARSFRLWPRSLYAQILLVAASALVIAQSVNAIMMLSAVRTRAVAETSVMVVSRVANQIERQGAIDGPRSDISNMRAQRNFTRFGRRPSNVAITRDSAPLDMPPRGLSA